MKKIKAKHMEWQLTLFLMSIYLSSWHVRTYKALLINGKVKYIQKSGLSAGRVRKKQAIIRKSE